MTVAPSKEHAAAALAEERAWLVFRLGAHVMCASALDVEGIIARPASIASLPFAPKYVLGTFLFRNRTATAISLRRKLGVRDGEDTALGPFIAARVRDAVVAFWVDEVKDVIEDRNAAWQPMPELLDGGIFDKYTLRAGELILHTSFAALLEAQGGLESVGRWASSGTGLRPPDAPAASPPQLVPAPAPMAPADAAAHAAPEAAREQAPHTSPPPIGASVPRAPIDAAPVQRRPAQRAAAAGQASGRTRDTPIGRAAAVRGVAPLRAPVPPVSAAPTSSIKRPPSAAPRTRGADAPPARRPGRAALRWGAIAFAVAMLAAGAYLLVPRDAPQPRAEIPKPAKRAESRATASLPVVALAEAPAAARPSAPAPRVDTGPAAPPAVTIEAETFRISIERAPRTPAAQSTASPARQAAGDIRVHVVVRGDTLWDIARKHLGDPYRYPELVRHSGIRNPDLIHPGDIVRIELRGARR